MRNNAITISFSGTIEIPMGYSTSWMKQEGLPKLGDTPFIPAPQVKAGWRRAAIHVITEQQQNKLPDITAYFYAAVGGVKGKKAEDDTQKVDDSSLSAFLALREKNPLVSLFGSGDAMNSFLAGRIYVGNFLAENPTIHQYKGVRSDDTRRNPDAMLEVIVGQDLDEAAKEIHARNRQRTGLKNQIKAKLAEAAKEKDPDKKRALRQEAAELEKEKDSLGGNPVSMPHDFEYVLADCFRGNVRLVHSNLVELGLLLQSMVWQSQNAPFLGGHTRLGFGEFSAVWKSKEGSIILRPFEEAHIEGSLLQEAMTAFTEALPEIDMTFGMAKGATNDKE